MARLEHLTPKARARPGGTGYTVFVRLLKILLPASALVIVGVVFAHLSKSPLREVEVAATAKDDKTAPGQIEVVGARYEGVDSSGHPYTLIADRARRAGTDDSRRAGADPAQSFKDSGDMVLFDGLKADIFLEDQSWLAVSAKQGSYAVKAQHLDLMGDVAAYHDSGYEMHLPRLSIDLKDRHAFSDTGVKAQGPLGEIAATGLEVLDAGNRIVFAGPVTMTLYHLGRKG
jgi:lipopolysaccharide export system protein LptC